jgi:hypothetical protein
MNYVIGTGWWCDGTGTHTHTKHQQYVDRDTRKEGFFELWYSAISKFTSPKEIILIDSNSPIKPNLEGKDNIKMLSTNKNYGAAVDGTSKGKLCGWSRGVLLGASYAYFNDYDYFVYIEQDCLIKGKGIVEHAIKNMGNAACSLGGVKSKSPQPLQQSFMIFKRSFIPKLLQAEMNATQDWLRISPERRYNKLMQGKMRPLPFGYGRSRPINFNDKFFYAQHLRTDELNTFKKILK